MIIPRLRANRARIGALTLLVGLSGLPGCGDSDTPPVAPEGGKHTTTSAPEPAGNKRGGPPMVKSIKNRGGAAAPAQP
jgi:hypothetical protein